jgi:lactoylglutathione lyase
MVAISFKILSLGSALPNISLSGNLDFKNNKDKNMMKFGYTIVYVSSVADTLAFYKAAFGFETRYLDESGQYGELNTGETILAFAAYEMGDLNLDGDYQKTDLNAKPFGIELAFVTEDVAAAYHQAIAAGAVAIKEPTAKSWGQVVAYVRDRSGSLIELCSPMGA